MTSLPLPPAPPSDIVPDVDEMVGQLKKFELESIRLGLNRDALKSCKTQAEEFTACSSQFFLSVIWKCRTEYNHLTECLKQHTTPEILESKKRDYVIKKWNSYQEHIQSQQKE